ncbi:MAG: hypothetical protein CMI60_08735, partial [Parvibaculum sp.]|nr:hypothetical protein [Parvibaculum sp.]
MNPQYRPKSKTGPSSQNNVASSPPSASADWVNPVDTVLARNAAAEQSTTAGNFTDDVMTPDDESTPQNEAVEEAIAQPPSLATSMGLLGDGTTSSRSPSDPKPTQANVVPYTSRKDNQPEWMNQFENKTPAPEPQDVSESLRELSGEGTQYNLDGQPIPPKVPIGEQEGFGEKPYEETRPTVKPASKEEPKQKYQSPEHPFMAESVSNPKDPKTAELRPIKQLKPVEQQHKDSFEEAFSGMVNDGSEPEAQATPEPQPDPTVAEVAPKAAPTKEEMAEELFNRVQNRKSLRQGEEPEYEEDDSKLDEKSRKAMANLDKIQERKRKRKAKAKAKETPKPDPTVAKVAPKAAPKKKEMP